MINLLLNSNDKSFLKKSEIANKEEMLTWKLPNLIYPLVVIFISLTCYLMFKDSKQINFVAFINLLLNGSLPMVALNRLSSLGVNLFRFDLSKDRQRSNNTYNLRITLHYYSLALVFVIAIFYTYQVINLPFNLSWTIFIQIIVAIFCIEQSLKVSKYAFLLQEKLIDTTYDKEMREDMEQKGHSKNWDK